MDDWKEIQEWQQLRHNEDIIRDILKADLIASRAEKQVKIIDNESDIIGNSLRSIARSLVTLNELILRGYAQN